MGFFTKLFADGTPEPTSLDLAYEVRLEENGDVWLYTEHGFKYQKLIALCYPDNKELQVFDNKIYLRRPERRVRVYDLNGRLLSTYFEPARGSWIMRIKN